MSADAFYAELDAWIDAHFVEEVSFLQELVRVPTDTPPGDNAPHAERTAELLEGFGFKVDRYPVPEKVVKEHGLASITNLVVRRRYATASGAGTTIALNAHGDVVPPGEGWTHDPYGGAVVGGKLYGRASAVQQERFRDLHLRGARARLADDGARWRHRIALHVRRGVRRRARPGLAAADGPRQARPAARCGLLLSGRDGAQRLPAARGDGARQDGPCSDPRHRRRCPAGVGRDPAGALRAERDLPQHRLEGRGDHASVRECRADRGWNQHQRRAGQGRAPARPPDDPRGRPGAGRSVDPQGHRRRRPSTGRVSRSTSAACCWRGRCSPCPATRPSLPR